MAETKLEMLSRQAVEGQQRLTMQRAFMQRLESSDLFNLMPVAREFLDVMLSWQAIADRHLAQEQDRLQDDAR